MPNFDSVLDVNMDDVKAPVPLPVGDYVFLIEGQPEITDFTSDKDGSSGKKAEFKVRPIKAMDTVDPEALEAYGWPTQRTQTVTFWFTSDPNSHYRFKEFCEKLGLNTAGVKTQPLMAQLPGKAFGCSVTKRPSKDGTKFYSQLNTATVIPQG